MTPVEVKPETQEHDVATPLEPAPNTEPGAVLEPSIVPLLEPSSKPKVPLCLFHETPIGENLTRGDQSFGYVFCLTLWRRNWPKLDRLVDGNPWESMG